MEKIKRHRKSTWRRQKRVRHGISGTTERPRLSVFRSHRHIYAQVIDDLTGRTLCSASTANKEIAEGVRHGGDIKAAEIVGETLAQRAIMHGIKRVVFDRGPYKFHGRVKALAESARKAGLEF